jgi:hypothetical protein
MVTQRIPIIKNFPFPLFQYNNQTLLPRNKIRYTLTSSFDDRIVHQKSHADVLNSSFDEYNTDKPKDKHVKKENIR